MVSPKSVLVVSVVDGDLDRDRSINQTDDSSRDSNEVGVPAIGRTSKSGMRETSATMRIYQHFKRLMGECLDIISG